MFGHDNPTETPADPNEIPNETPNEPTEPTEPAETPTETRTPDEILGEEVRRTRDAGVYLDDLEELKRVETEQAYHNVAASRETANETETEIEVPEIPEVTE